MPLSAGVNSVKRPTASNFLGACKGGGWLLFTVRRPCFFGSLKVFKMGDSYEVQEVSVDTSPAVSPNPVEPLYFMAGFIAGLIFISLFKGRWFL